MKRVRQNSYVKRELIRRRVEKRQRAISKTVSVLASIALVFCIEVCMFALFLM